MSLSAELYPFATQDGKPIPLEIINPISLIYKAITIAIDSQVLTADFNLSAIYATEHCIIDTLGAFASVISGTAIPGGLFIPKNTVVMAVLPTGTIKVKTLSTSGYLFIQGINKWAGMNLPRQYTGKVA